MKNISLETQFPSPKFFVSRLVFFANTPPKHDISFLITPYIRMLSSDWLMKGIFFFFTNSYFFQLFRHCRGICLIIPYIILVEVLAYVINLLLRC